MSEVALVRDGLVVERRLDVQAASYIRYLDANLPVPLATVEFHSHVPLVRRDRVLLLVHDVPRRRHVLGVRQPDCNALLRQLKSIGRDLCRHVVGSRVQRREGRRHIVLLVEHVLLDRRNHSPVHHHRRRVAGADVGH